jgi:hypothetical protein
VNTKRRDDTDRVAMAARLLVVAAVTLMGCGNYSNEDLDYLSALPQSDDLSVEAPKMSAVRPALEDDALQTTTEVTTKLNAMAGDLLKLIDQIRAGYPTSRHGDQRTWGPGPSDNSPGWQVEFTMTKDAAAVPVTFAYDLMMIPPGAATGLSVLSGTFQAIGGARGVGHLALTPAMARDAGAVLPGLEKLMSLTIDYDSQDWPRTLTIEAINLPTVDTTMDALDTKYSYQRAQNGDGAMAFTFLKDVVNGPMGIDTLQITSHWQGMGAGRADIAVTAGDGAGLISWTDCWAPDSTTAYNSRTGAGDTSACIPLL